MHTSPTPRTRPTTAYHISPLSQKHRAGPTVPPIDSCLRCALLAVAPVAAAAAATAVAAAPPTAAAIAATPAAAAAAAAALVPVLGHVHAEGAAHELDAVRLLDCALSEVHGGVRHEAEAARAAGVVPLHDDDGVLDRPELAEELLEVLASGPEVEVAHVQPDRFPHRCEICPWQKRKEHEKTAI
eukprot:CAMPEP_0206255792 /NCGR_PEP_ID=MMETSP0047_2-20121206/24428_1 /ASSEMBLY_ACC=CAM_ASM_000192 /TAXON_ID=195065 /ORGANISM="Chroomonas mesostigmatica_cf, Strain CCMP1168" /LENGTH=184 /DNA_ID=CAMNT_0053682199 /DNA_START=291 /DNA_END=842 /DNA_ORIENTATION=+